MRILLKGVYTRKFDREVLL